MDTIESLVKKALIAKRAGQFDLAVEMYRTALTINNEQPAMHASLSKSLYLCNLRQEALKHYFISLSLSIIDYAKQNGLHQAQLQDIRIRSQLSKKFINTIIHLAHAYIDLDQISIQTMINDIANTHKRMGRADIETIVHQVISSYRFGLAGGGIIIAPDPIKIKHELDFIEIYSEYGYKLALNYIKWDGLRKYVA